jgi:hypothetical protein
VGRRHKRLSGVPLAGIDVTASTSDTLATWNQTPASAITGENFVGDKLGKDDDHDQSRRRMHYDRTEQRLLFMDRNIKFEWIWEKVSSWKITAGPSFNV